MNLREKLQTLIPTLKWRSIGECFVSADYYDYVIAVFRSDFTKQNSIIIKDKRLHYKEVESIYQDDELVDLAFSVYSSQNKDESKEKSKEEFYKLLNKTNA